MLQKLFCWSTLVSFMLAAAVPAAHAGGLLLPGVAARLYPEAVACSLQGLRYYPDEPLRFDFIVDPGLLSGHAAAIEGEAQRFICYFLAGLTTPKKDLWVNLSPREGGRVIPHRLGLTELGRDLLRQDYILKQATASFLDPRAAEGKEFWRRVYALAQEKFGTTQVPLDVFHKVWIVPGSADVMVRNNVVWVADARLKLMLRQDGAPEGGAQDSLMEDVLRDVMLPALEREVNESARFAPVRQAYRALVLAVWLKEKMAASGGNAFSRAYADKNKVAGVDHGEKLAAGKIWGRYVASLKRGAFSLVREEKDFMTGDILPRKYFSGGEDYSRLQAREVEGNVTAGGHKDVELVSVRLQPVAGAVQRPYALTEIYHNPHFRRSFLVQDPNSQEFKELQVMDVGQDPEWREKLQHALNRYFLQGDSSRQAKANAYLDRLSPTQQVLVAVNEQGGVEAVEFLEHAKQQLVLDVWIMFNTSLLGLETQFAAWTLTQEKNRHQEFTVTHSFENPEIEPLKRIALRTVNDGVAALEGPFFRVLKEAAAGGNISAQRAISNISNGRVLTIGSEELDLLESVLEWLQGQKALLEDFVEVMYSDDALEYKQRSYEFLRQMLLGSAQHQKKNFASSLNILLLRNDFDVTAASNLEYFRRSLYKILTLGNLSFKDHGNVGGQYDVINALTGITTAIAANDVAIKLSKRTLDEETLKQFARKVEGILRNRIDVSIKLVKKISTLQQVDTAWLLHSGPIIDPRKLDLKIDRAEAVESPGGIDLGIEQVNVRAFGADALPALDDIDFAMLDKAQGFAPVITGVRTLADVRALFD